jgi:hypothetical protein
VSTALRTSTILGSQTVSNEGMALKIRGLRMRQFSHVP